MAKKAFMPIYTNKFGLPQPLFDAVANDKYDKGDSDISVTGLLKPARITVLEKDHAEEIEEDVSERIWSLIGQVMHGVLERAEATEMNEERFFTTLDGVRLSGQVDRYVQSKGLLQDYKLVTLYKFKVHGWGVPPEFEQQLNSYAYLLRATGYDVNKIELIAVLRDWSKMEASRNRDYPQVQVLVLDVPIWPEEKIVTFLRARIKAYKDAHVSLPECTAEERWARDPSWAVMKPGRKSALRVLKSKDSATLWAQNQPNPSALQIVHRPGENIRCENYCSVAPFCDQYQRLRGQNE